MKRTIIVAVLTSFGFVTACSRALDEEVPPEEQPRKRCTGANAYGYDAENGGTRIWINAESGATLNTCLCASDVDMEDYDVEDALVSQYVEACELRAHDLGASLEFRPEYPANSLPTCDDAAVDLRESDRVINYSDVCAESSFPLD